MAVAEMKKRGVKDFKKVTFLFEIYSLLLPCDAPCYQYGKWGVPFYI